ncbi:MAG: N-acetylmannosamine-6-phosphate 2-epimerase [Ignavibacteria bacterium]|nr:N-acetylmannosamine-6-phosphate 2-epimerase [Ignavibacteria bacterium]
MNNILEQLRNGLIVSCQAEDDDPFNSPEGVALFAKAAMMGGARGIRSEGIEKTRSILKSVNIPVIGLVKSKFDDGSVCITRNFNEVESLHSLGCDMIAIDGTHRSKNNLSGPEFIQLVREKFNCTIMADISTVEEAIASIQAGADCVSTTLSGYTPQTLTQFNTEPDFDLVKNLVARISIPVFAEGRISTPMQARKMIELGAWAVVVGTWITRPRIITKYFVEEILKAKGKCN